MVELCLNLSESRQLDFELPADVAELFFNRGDNDVSGRRRSCRAAFAARPALSASPTLTTLAAFSALAVCALTTPADRL